MKEKMILKGDKSVAVLQMLSDDYQRLILAKAQAAAKSLFGANYPAAIEPACEELRSLMADCGLDALTAGYLLTSEMERIGNANFCSKGITLAAIYEVDQAECAMNN